MDKPTALNQVVRLLALTASYIQANDPERSLASLSIVSDVMEENNVTPDDVEALLVLNENEETEEVAEDAEAPLDLRSRIEQMVSDVRSIPNLAS